MSFQAAISMDQNRQQALYDFLRRENIFAEKIIKIAGDASFRSYYRIFLDDGETLILMDAPPEFEDIRPFVKIDKFLCDHAITAPKMFGIDFTHGFIALEDFGDVSLNKFLAPFSGGELLQQELEIYKLACEQLLMVQNLPVHKIELQPYNEQRLMNEVSLLTEWYLPKISGVTIEESALKDYQQIWQELFSHLPSPSVLVLRDYHADNLMLAEKYHGPNKIGLLDFQDALFGHRSYDLVSLIDDIRRDVSAKNRQLLVEYYLQIAQRYNAEIDQQEFLDEYNLLSSQRNIKIAGIFARLAFRDHKKSYLNYLPQVIATIKSRLESKSNNLSFVEIRKFLLSQKII